MEGQYSSESMMKQAQQVWSMLDDMADNDPKAYRSFIDKQMNEKKEFTSPAEPHMCVVTQMVKPQNVPFYMNFCTWKRIPAPANPEEPVKVAGSAVGQVNDEKGKAAVTAVAFNEKILQEFGKDATNKTDQDTLIQIAMDFIEKQHSHIKLNRKYKVLDRSHKGSIKVMQDSLFHAFKAKDKEFDNKLSEVLQGFAPLATESPESLLGKLSENNESTDVPKTNDTLGDKLSGITLDIKPTKKGLIEEMGSTVNSGPSLPEPVYDLVTNNAQGHLTLKINLPGVKSVSECELDISKDDVSLYVEDKYELKLNLPAAIVDDDASAKFNKKTSVLQLTMPLAR